MKAIETEYKEILFRSRLEARWAILFDALKIGWVYEPECYILSNNQKYTPDFYIERYDLFIEIKPNFEWLKDQYHYNRYKLFEEKLLVLSGEYPNFNVNALINAYPNENNILNDANVIFCPKSKYQPFFYSGYDLGEKEDGFNEDYQEELNIVKKYRFY